MSKQSRTTVSLYVAPPMSSAWVHC
jgi:hypothetical protein